MFFLLWFIGSLLSGVMNLILQITMDIYLNEVWMAIITIFVIVYGLFLFEQDKKRKTKIRSDI